MSSVAGRVSVLDEAELEIHRLSEEGKVFAKEELGLAVGVEDGGESGLGSRRQGVLVRSGDGGDALGWGGHRTLSRGQPAAFISAPWTFISMRWRSLKRGAQPIL